MTEFRPDLAILDVRLPVAPDGFAIARPLRGSSEVPLLLLSAVGELYARLARLLLSHHHGAACRLQGGGDDHLVKPFSMAELRARVYALLRRSGRLGAASTSTCPTTSRPASATSGAKTTCSSA